MTKVFSSGVFDVLNVGHLNILTQASTLGDQLIVGIQSDDSVKESKGKYPVLNIKERISQIQALPFVTDIIVYENTDQRQLWSEIKPDVIVQGDDYIHSSDRTAALKYIKEKGIRLVLLPRTPGISSTEIKKRILYSDRKDVVHLQQLKLLPLDTLNIYEEFQEDKVNKLYLKIKKENKFSFPISVGKIDELNIVVDGVNRLEALKRLKCNFALCLVIPYNDINLTNNIHYKNKNRITRLSEFFDKTGEEIIFDKRSHLDIVSLIRNNQTIPNGETWHQLPYNIINFNVTLNDLKSGFDINQRIDDMLQDNNIRYFSTGVYNCNEWY